MSKTITRSFRGVFLALEVTQTHFWTLVAPCSFAGFKNDSKALRRRIRLVATFLPGENEMSGELLRCDQLHQCRALQKDLPNV